MNASLKRKIKILLSPFYRIGLINKDFSIISNNCWAGFYYDRYHIIYKTPTIGLFIPPKDYIKFISNLTYYLSIDDIKQISSKESKYYLMLKRKQEKKWINNIDELIIGKIDDIEIIFLHYTSFDEAVDKWNKRKKRINYDNLVIKFNDQNELEESDFINFKNLNIKNKIFFTSNRKFISDFSFFEEKYEKKYGFCYDDMHCQKFKFKRFINDISIAKK